MPICDLNESKARAIEYIKKIDSVKTDITYNKVGTDRVVDTHFTVSTELTVKEQLIDVEFEVKFKDDFPLSLPELYLSKKSYETFKHLPHVDSDRKICTLDTAATITNYKNPEGILYEVIKKAKKVLKDGIEKRNVDDFEEEFIAYWNSAYSGQNKLVKGLSLINYNQNPETIKAILVEPKFGGYDFIIYSDDEAVKNIIELLKSKGHDVSNIETFFLNEVSFKNGNFLLRNGSSIDLLKTLPKPESIFKYINTAKIPILIFKKVIDGMNLYFGWTYEKPKNNFSHGRKKQTLVQTLSQYYSDKFVRGISFDQLSQERFDMRCGVLETHEHQKQTKIIMAGLGSIGSNLINYLRSQAISQYTLIDPDYMSVENVSRHLLGLDYVSLNKAQAMKRFLQTVNPMATINTFDKLLAPLIDGQPEIFNSHEYMFVSIGSINTELWVDSAVKDGLINIPVFYLWVEPYLAGGHCVFIHPKSALKFSDLFDKEGYKYNILSSKVYKESTFIKRETGCQISYVPYSLSNVTLFLSSIYPEISRIMSTGLEESRIVTWVGDKTAIGNLNYELSDFANDKSSGEVIVS